MKVITCNVNGIRAAAKKGFFDWLLKQKADVVCVQETKAQIHQLEDAIFHPKGYHCQYFDAISKKGYSGVAIYSKIAPKNWQVGLGFDLADSEGRYIQADYNQLSIASLYLPSGTSGDVRQTLKYEFLDKLEQILLDFRRKRRHYILCGDWNIAHKQIDLKNWRGNQKNSGFLPEERAFMDKLFSDKMRYVDAFRLVNQQPDQYTWWSNRGRAYENNVGWRIDYQVISKGLSESVQSADIYTKKRFSDHAPLVVNYDWTLA